MRFFASHRRHPMAGFSVMLAALFITGFGFAVVDSGTEQVAAETVSETDFGKQLNKKRAPVDRISCRLRWAILDFRGLGGLGRPGQPSKRWGGGRNPSHKLRYEGAAPQQMVRPTIVHKRAGNNISGFTCGLGQ